MLLFQALIGTVETYFGHDYTIYRLKFQALIGTVETGPIAIANLGV